MYCKSDEAGIGVIVRNSFSEVKAALAEKIRKPPSVEALELLDVLPSFLKNLVLTLLKEILNRL